MGMAASQARLLTLTARIHDVEYMAQSIQNAKLQLATKEDQIQQDYLDALDATTLTVKTLENGQTTKVVANFKNLFSMDRVQPASIGTNCSYALHDKYGRLVVPDEIYAGYKQFKSEGFENNAYMFALYMMGEEGNKADYDDMCDAQESIYENIDELAETKSQKNANATLNEMHNQILSLLSGENGETIDDIYDTSMLQDENKEEYEKTLSKYENILYKNYAKEIFVELSDITCSEATEEDFDQSIYTKYVNFYKQIEASGDCVSIKDSQFVGVLGTGDPENDSEWLKNQIESGTMSIDLAVVDKDGNVTFNGTSPSSDSSISYTNTTEIDSRAMKIAEAKYNHDMKQIDKKDKQFDMSLSKLETERTALTTEYDSVKKVTEDNIERTFGIFS